MALTSENYCPECGYPVTEAVCPNCKNHIYPVSEGCEPDPDEEYDRENEIVNCPFNI